MTTSTSHFRYRPRRNPLAFCLAIALGGVAVAHAADAGGPRQPASQHLFGPAARSATALPVTSCADDGSDGTLRSVMTSAPSGATIDLTQLTCSTITLEMGAIDNDWREVTLLGPGADRLTIDGNYQDRVFKAGSITIDGLTVTHGRVSGDYANGGCIAAAIGVELRSVRVVSCSAYGTLSASGGGISAGYFVRLQSSTVSDNRIVATTGYAAGGGISAPYSGVVAEFSTISGNSATGNPAEGGGVFAMGYSRATNSTVDNNVADVGGGWFCQRSWIGPGTCKLVDSTLSGNTARVRGGGLVAEQASLYVLSSTIAFNTAQSGHVGGVLMTRNGIPETITLQSSIFAHNTAAGTDLAADIDTDAGGFPAVVGGNDLMTSVGRIQPFPLVIDDPQLAPLAANGGLTLTHALLPGSPAIDAGNNVAGLDIDQRGAARVAGAAADIGAYEVQPEQIFANGFD